MLIPLLTDEFVRKTGVLTMAQFGNLMSIAQATPGPVGLNTATYIGYIRGGFPGALAASLGLVAPTILIGSFAVAGIARWKNRFLVRGMLSGTRMASTALVMFAVTIFLGMSVFTSEIPWKELFSFFLRKNSIPSHEFGVSPSGLIICAVSGGLMARGKIPTSVLLLGSAVTGALLAAFFS